MTRSDSAKITASKGGNEGTQKHEETTYRVQDGESVTEAVVRAVSSETGRDRRELNPLYSIVDTDALNTLFVPLESGVPRQTNGIVGFDYSGQHVCVTSDGAVRIDRNTPR